MKERVLREASKEKTMSNI